MQQKRVLVIGAILVAAGIGAPTTAMLTRGGALPESPTPVLEATTPAPPEPPYVPIEVGPPTELPPTSTSAPRRVSVNREVPSHLGEEPAPPRRPEAGNPPGAGPATPSPAGSAVAPQPQPQDTEPVSQAPTMPTVQPDPGDEGGDPPILPPPGFPDFDPDPADQ